MEIKKFTSYEFEVVYNDSESKSSYPVNVEYKVDESGDGDSRLRFSDLGVDYDLPADLILQLASAMREISPFDFAFDEE